MEEKKKGKISKIVLMLFVLRSSCLVETCLGYHHHYSSRDDAFIGYREIHASSHNTRSHPAHPARKELIFTTEYGDIRVELLHQAAPVTVHYIEKLVKAGLYEGCAFYRAELPGETQDTGKSGTRKGYALVQGGMYSCGRQQSHTLPVESFVANTKGTISLIAGTSEFFFNLEDHIEWDGSFTVWGKVIGGGSWGVVERLASLPTREELHPTGTVLRILLDEVKFSVRLEG